MRAGQVLLSILLVGGCRSRGSSQEPGSIAPTGAGQPATAPRSLATAEATECSAEPLTVSFYEIKRNELGKQPIPKVPLTPDTARVARASHLTKVQSLPSPRFLAPSDLSPPKKPSTPAPRTHTDPIVSSRRRRQNARGVG